MIGERTVSDIRRDIFKQILVLSPEFYENNKSANVISNMISDAELLKSVIGSTISVAMRNVVTMIGALIMMSAISAKLFGLIALVIPIVVIPIMIFAKKMKNHSKISQEKNTDIAAITQETVLGIKTIQSYTYEKFEYSRFKDKLAEYIEAATNRVISRSFLITLVISLSFGSVAGVLWVGSHDVMSGNLTAGQLSSFVFIAVLCAGSVGALTEVIGELQRAAGATERLAEFMSLKPYINKPKDPKFITNDARGKISFNNVTFFYPTRPSKPVLHDFNLEILPAKITAIVGQSGAGKTTIFQLLLRFYDCQSGAIFFDNTPITEIDLSSLRSQFAYVDQEPTIFSSTILDNVLYGNKDAKEDDVMKALDSAAALEFVSKLPNGIYTEVGERGVKLSTGQKQRLVIARAFLRNPKILLFDEATSALDSGNEKIVHAAAENLMKNRTTIVIAHRLSTIKNADKIVVVKDGVIVEQGKHDDLLKLDAYYSKLVNDQS
jgi:ATP-binding cassette subfamily B protein